MDILYMTPEEVLNSCGKHVNSIRRYPDCEVVMSIVAPNGSMLRLWHPISHSQKLLYQPVDYQSGDIDTHAKIIKAFMERAKDVVHI